MTRHLLAIAALVAVLASCVSATAGEQLGSYGRIVQVERVLDGDTIVTSGDERVRLLSVDAPELNARTKADDAECGAQAAADALAELLPPGTDVAVAGLPGEPATDRYGRTLANVYVQLSGGPILNVSLHLVELGLVRVYEEYPTVETALAGQAQQRARAGNTGLWATCEAAS